MLDEIVPDFNKVLAFVEQGKGSVIKKDDNKDPHLIATVIPRNEFHHGMQFSCVFGNKVISMYIRDFANKYGNHLREYATKVCNPINQDPFAFNLWQGFNADIITDPEINILKEMEGINNFIYKIFCDQKKEYFDYFMGYMWHLIKFPWKKTGVNLVLHGEQGTGKSIFFTMLLEFVFKFIGAEISGFEHLLGNFNGIVEGVNLLVINEANSTKDKFIQDFNKFKNLSIEKI